MYVCVCVSETTFVLLCIVPFLSVHFMHAHIESLCLFVYRYIRGHTHTYIYLYWRWM